MPPATVATATFLEPGPGSRRRRRLSSRTLPWQHFLRISDNVETKATKAIPSPHTCDCPFSTPLNIRCLALFEEKAHASDIYTRTHTHCSTYTLVSDYQGSVFVEKEHDSPSHEPRLACLTSAWWRQLSALGRWFIHAIHGGQEGGHRHRQWQKDRGEKVKTWFPRNRAFNQTISCSELCLYSLVQAATAEQKHSGDSDKRKLMRQLRYAK